MKNNHTWVICAYGKSEFLEVCILSLQAQTLSSKIICYSSTPLDSIKQLCQKYGIPFYTKEGGGIGKDWNNALSFVETSYATIAHQDDYYEPTYLEAVMQKIEQSKDILIAYTDYFEEKNGVKIPANTNLKIKTLMLKTLNLIPASRFWRNRVLAFGNPISCPAVTYNLELLRDFRFDEEMRVSIRVALLIFLRSLCATGFMESLKQPRLFQIILGPKKICSCISFSGLSGWLI